MSSSVISSDTEYLLSLPAYQIPDENNSTMLALQLPQDHGLLDNYVLNKALKGGVKAARVNSLPRNTFLDGVANRSPFQVLG